jgi:hydroxysqualene synthase
LILARRVASQCRAVGVDHYENFPVASWLCPPRLRTAVRAIYWFARTADDIADEGIATTAQRLERLSHYAHALEHTLAKAVIASGQDSHDEDSPAGMDPAWRPVFLALGEAIESHRLPPQPLRDLLDAFTQDASNPTHDDRASLLDYCRRSANPVGRLMLHLVNIDDATSRRQSDCICTALQLANFWQDLSVDMPRGRHYLPRSELLRAGFGPDDWPGDDTDETRRLLADLVDWTRRLMLEGAPLTWHVPGRMGWELRLVVQGGLRILDRITAADYRVMRWRPTLGPSDIAPMAWRALRMRRAALRRVALPHTP